MATDLKKASLQELREQTKDLEYDDRRRIFAAALDTKDLDDGEAAALAVVQRIWWEQRGIDTPIEQFVYQQVTALMRDPLTLEDVRDYVKEFEENWLDVLKTARKYYREYPQLVTGSKAKPQTETDGEIDDGGETDG